MIVNRALPEMEWQEVDGIVCHPDISPFSHGETLVIEAITGNPPWRLFYAEPTCFLIGPNIKTDYVVVPVLDIHLQDNTPISLWTIYSY